RHPPGDPGTPARPRSSHAAGCKAPRGRAWLPPGSGKPVPRRRSAEASRAGSPGSRWAPGEPLAEPPIRKSTWSSRRPESMVSSGFSGSSKVAHTPRSRSETSGRVVRSVCRAAGQAGAAAGGELVVGVPVRLTVGTLGRQLRQRPLDLAPDTAEGDAEDTLATRQQVDDLVGRGAHVNAGPVTHQG